MPRYKTFDNDQIAVSGEMLPSDLNVIQDAYEEAFSGWRAVARTAMVLTNATTRYSYGSASDSTDPLISGFVLDPADFATAIATPRAARVRVRIAVALNATAPAADVRVGVVRVTSAGGAGQPASTATTNLIDPAGTDAAKVVTPAAASLTVAVGNAIALGAAGVYAMAAQFSVAPAAGSQALIVATLQLKQV